MDLPNIFSSRTNSQNEVLVLFIILSDTRVQTLLLGLSSSGIEIRDKSLVADYDSVEDCLIKTDSCFSQLSKESESVNEVIFGLNTSWIKAGQVADEKKPILKKLTDDLSLKPLGFIDLSEAVSEQELVNNSLFSGIIALVSNSDLVLTLLHQGKIKSSQTVGKSDDFRGDFNEGLARFQELSESENFYLPSRIILASFDIKESELREHQQVIYDADWKDQKQFLQPPTVEVLLEKQFVKIVSMEAGKAAALQKDLKEAVYASTSALKDKSPEDEVDNYSTSGDDELDNNDDYEVDNSEDFGFQSVASDQTNLNKDEELMEQSLDEHNDQDTVLENLPKSFGIPIKSTAPPVSAMEDSSFINDDGSPKSPANKKADLFSTNTKTSKFHKNPKLFIVLGFILGLVVLGLVGFFGAGLMANTELIITPEKKSVSTDTQITLTSSQDKVSSDEKSILARTITRAKSSKSTLQTTGVTVVGERAKGKVIVYNLTEAEKIFEAGSVLRTGNLEFELDEEIKVASASSSRGSTVHGQAEVRVTARQIGAESNLEKDTELTVVPFDSNTYNAFVDKNGFSGGTSREVRVVAQDDIDSLLIDLRNELIEEINNEIDSEFNKDVNFLPTKKIINSNSDFSAGVGDEADNLTLNLTLELETLTYDSLDVRPLAEKLLSGDVADGYILIDEDPQILQSPSTSIYGEGDEGAFIEVKISSYAIPDFDIEALKQEVLGKSFSDAKAVLLQRSDIKEVEFVVNPAMLRALIRRVSNSEEKLKISFSI